MILSKNDILYVLNSNIESTEIHRYRFIEYASSDRMYVEDITEGDKFYLQAIQGSEYRPSSYIRVDVRGGRIGLPLLVFAEVEYANMEILRRKRVWSLLYILPETIKRMSMSQLDELERVVEETK